MGGEKAVMGRLVRQPAVLLWLSIAAFTFAFLGTSALGMGPDEPVHYIKAAATARGDILGERVSAAEVRENYPIPVFSSDDPADRARAKRIAESGTFTWREYSLPASVAIIGLPDFPCFATLREIPGSCGPSIIAQPKNPESVYSSAGAYPPSPYFVYGLGSLVPGSRAARWYGARIAGAALALAVLASAFALLLEGSCRRGWLVAALAIAVPPTSVFTFAVVNPSSLELAGGLAVAAAVVRLGRDAAPTRRTWSLVAFAAVALAVSRPLGPYWLAPFGLILVVLAGWRNVRSLLLHGRAPRVAMTAVAAAALSTLLWARLNEANLPLLWDRVPEAARAAVSNLILVVLQLPGIFGWNETPIAIPWTWLYGTGLVALVAVAIVFGTRRQRAALLLAIAISIVMVVLIAMPLEMYAQRYAMQARYVLPFAVLIPLLVADALSRAAARAPDARPPGTPWYPTGGLLPAAVITFMTTVQLVGWWTNAVRNANGFGGFAFWGEDAWTPPLGWAPWLVLVLVGVVSGLGAAWLVWRSPAPADAVVNA
jgi:hypothetical protein